MCLRLTLLSCVRVLALVLIILLGHLPICIMFASPSWSCCLLLLLIIVNELVASLPSYLVHLSLAEELSVLDELKARRRALLAEDQGVPVLVQLAHDGAYLEVKLALVTEGLHLLGQDLLILLIVLLLFTRNREGALIIRCLAMG